MVSPDKPKVPYAYAPGFNPVDSDNEDKGDNEKLPVPLYQVQESVPPSETDNEMGGSEAEETGDRGPYVTNDQILCALLTEYNKVEDVPLYLVADIIFENASQVVIDMVTAKYKEHGKEADFNNPDYMGEVMDANHYLEQQWYALCMSHKDMKEERDTKTVTETVVLDGDSDGEDDKDISGGVGKEATGVAKKTE